MTLGSLTITSSLEVTPESRYTLGARDFYFTQVNTLGVTGVKEPGKSIFYAVGRSKQSQTSYRCRDLFIFCDWLIAYTQWSSWKLNKKICIRVLEVAITYSSVETVRQQVEVRRVVWHPVLDSFRTDL